MDHQIGMEKARENLASAQLCFDQGYFNACANRLYYAMFQAAIAVLAQAGLLPAGGRVSHDWLQANFSSHFIHRRKLFSAKLKSYLPEAYRVRALADYEAISVSKNIAANELKKAKEFVAVVNAEVSHATQP